MSKALILIVDDNPINLELAADLLMLESFRVMVVDNGTACLDVAQKEAPDLILMDIRMPDMSGLEAMQYLRKMEATAHIPIVALTASVMTGEKERLLAAGFDGFMQKPIDVASFVDDVRSFMGSRASIQ
ncbi:MAG: response regulator [Mariprofundaceae bacterium]|nr:response regulator [Mariprofundaceae bacterium]